MITREYIIEFFLQSSTEHGEAIAIGDHKKANMSHENLHKIYNNAKELNMANVFAEFLKEDNQSIRFWAAIFSLNFSSGLAEKTLEELSELPSITGLSAKTTLFLWKEGKLDLI